MVEHLNPDSRRTAAGSRCSGPDLTCGRPSCAAYRASEPVQLASHDPLRLADLGAVGITTERHILVRECVGRLRGGLGFGGCHLNLDQVRLALRGRLDVFHGRCRSASPLSLEARRCAPGDDALRRQRKVCRGLTVGVRLWRLKRRAKNLIHVRTTVARAAELDARLGDADRIERYAAFDGLLVALEEGGHFLENAFLLTRVAFARGRNPGIGGVEVGEHVVDESIDFGLEGRRITRGRARI